jgi:hypothetical protein
MLEAWILNKLLINVSLFFIALKLVNRALRVNVSLEFYDESDEGLKGVVWTSLNGILNQVEHV